MLWKGRATLALTDHWSSMRHAQGGIQLGLASKSQHAQAEQMAGDMPYGQQAWQDILGHILLLWAQLVLPTEPEVSGRDRIWGSWMISEP